MKIWYILSITAYWSSNLKILLHMYDIYNCDYLQCKTFRFNLIDFQLNRDFPSKFCVFYRKITFFFRKTIGWNNSFNLIEKKNKVFKIAKFELMVIVHYGLWAKCTQLRGYCASGHYFWRLCAFSQKIKQRIIWIWSEMFQGTQKLQFYFNIDHCCEFTVKNVRKSIFSMFWAINQ